MPVAWPFIVPHGLLDGYHHPEIMPRVLELSNQDSGGKLAIGALNAGRHGL